MLKAFFTYLFWATLTQSIESFPSGPPISSPTCTSMNPAGHFFQPKELGYMIETSKDWFYPSEVLTVSISSTSNNTFPIRGLMMQVRDSDQAFTGSFMAPPPEEGYKLMGCETLSAFSDRPAGSTVSHANRDDKNTATFHWMAPASCGGSNDYSVRATVLRNFATYQVGVNKALECRNRPTEASTTEESTVDPGEGMRDSPCRFANVTSLPPDGKYTTSFETRRDTNGWMNKGWRPNFTPTGRRWRRKSGRTLSRRTGPDKAAEGRYYMYYETSFLGFVGDVVALESEMDLRGCFCLKLQHSHNVGSGLDHKFRITVGDEEKYLTKTRRQGWKQLRIQVDSPEYVQIRIMGIKGFDFRGDTAIDNIKLEEGWCAEKD